jgi:flagellar protein FlgJ
MSAGAIPPSGAARRIPDPTPRDPASGAPSRAIGASPPPRDDHAALKKLAQDLEGLFVNQLFQAMRASVPSTGISGQTDPGQELFTSMFDQSMAQETARHMNRGLSDALYHQLVRRLGEGSEPTR